MGAQDNQLMIHNDDKLMVYSKGEAVFAFNFHSSRSYEGLFLPMESEGEYQVLMSTDDFCYGGNGRIYHQTYSTVKNADGKVGIKVYLPSRTAVVLKKV